MRFSVAVLYTQSEISDDISKNECKSVQLMTQLVQTEKC